MTARHAAEAPAWDGTTTKMTGMGAEVVLGADDNPTARVGSAIGSDRPLCVMC